MKYILVETISMFRMRYVIEMPEEDPSDWALDTVTMEDAEEFSQLHLDEVISSHRELTKEQVLELAEQDEGISYFVERWTDEKILDKLVTKPV